MTYAWERRCLQAAILLAGFVPVISGAAGMLFGVSIVSDMSEDRTLDNHFRYLSGLLLGIGLVFWYLIPGIERQGKIFRAMTALVVLGGLGRLFGMIVHGLPSPGMIAALGMELVITPALFFAQLHLATRFLKPRLPGGEGQELRSAGIPTG